MTKVLIGTAHTSHDNQTALMGRYYEAHLKFSVEKGYNYNCFYDKAAKGFSFAMNHNIANAIAGDYDYLLLLGNDGIPMNRSWLNTLIQTQKKTGAGIVSPVPNNPSLSVYDHLKKSDHGDYAVYSMFPAICWLIPREVIVKVGFFDERFKGGCYEDTDYCVRVKAAGYKIVVDKTVMIDHLLSQTIKHMNPSQLMQDNYKLYKEKYK